jgi:Family of unknown function (DUF6499)
MPDWKIDADYKFTGELKRDGWAWEFMRRNESYCHDYLEAQKLKSETFLHKIAGDAEHIPPAIRLARKWRIVPPIPDPNGHETPKFDLLYPVEPSYEDIGDYYDDGEPSQTGLEFAVLVFDLTAPMDFQLKNAKRRLAKLQKDKKLRDRLKFHKKNWTNYLRLLDGEMAGASPVQLQKYIKAYTPKSGDADHKHKASDMICDHRDAAELLRDHPRSILFLST